MSAPVNALDGPASPQSASTFPPEHASGSSAHAKYFPYFDWLRFALACTVMLVHFGSLQAWPPAGTFAVQVFFALSGWLIGGILLDTKIAELPRFYFNRSVRIWVPYYLGLLLLVVASVLHEPITHKWLEFVSYKLLFVWNLFGTQQLGTFHDAMPLKGTGNHFWSVNAEEQFYLLAPLLLVVSIPKIGRSLILWSLIAAAAYLTGLYASIVFGIMAALVHRRFPDFQRRLWVQAALVVVLLVCIRLFMLDAEVLLVAPWCAVAIVLLLARPGKPFRLGVMAGGLSYQLYLNHWIGGFIATVLLIPFGMRDSALHLPLAILIAIPLGFALYWFVDRPLLSRRSRFFSPKRAKVAMWAGYGIVLTGIALGIVITRFSS